VFLHRFYIVEQIGEKQDGREVGILCRKAKRPQGESRR
jgi:hypothetical protein